MLTTPQQATYPQIIGADPFPGIVRDMPDWQDAARKFHVLCGAPSYVTIAEVEFHFGSLFRRYCAFCEFDHMVAAKDQHVADLNRGYGQTHNSLRWFLINKIKSIRNPARARAEQKRMEALFNAWEEQEARNKAEDRAKIKRDTGYKMPRERAKNALGANRQRKAAKAFDVPREELSKKMLGQESKGHRRETDADLLSEIYKLGQYLVGNKPFILPEKSRESKTGYATRQFPRWKLCVEAFLQAADPRRIDPAAAKPIAYWTDLPSRKFYRDIDDDLAKNPT